MSINLLDLDGEGLAAFVASLDEKPFRVRQVKRWIHRLGESDFSRMSDIAKPLREKLARTACVSPPRIVSDSLARDGTRKWLLDVDNTVSALKLMIDEDAYGLSRRRVTLSTSGIVPMIDRLAAECPVALAVSLHAPNDALRDTLMPINRKYPLAELLAACLRYLERAPRDFITFEYVMLEGVNDAEEHARQLVDLVSRVPCKINLIPFNPFPNSGFVRSPRRVIERFSEVLGASGIVTTTRKTRGDEIDAACGQLAGKIHDRTRRPARLEGAGS